MPLKPSYCNAILFMKEKDFSVHKIYHDKQYGFSIEDDNELFCRLVLEINQAGLSWSTILHKEKNFRKAYSNFNIKKVASYNDMDIQRLLNDKGIIRNRLKIDAAIYNANEILKIQKEKGSFKKWLDAHHSFTKGEWVKLFKTIFRFTGGEIVNEFLMSTGYLPGAHDENCPIQKEILSQQSTWKNA